ncbi:MAG: exosortase-associated EpsI family protein [Planctomycetota bacterium]|nr:exosortase-associated EpsI family protein [Planctomycetota bacterium]
MMSKLSILAVMIAVCLTVYGGYIEGARSQRFGRNEAQQLAGQQIAQLPESFGDWYTVESHDLDPDVADLLKCTGSVQRVYGNRQNGEKVRVALLAGPPGPISVHSPEICYSASDYKIEEPPVEVSVSRADKDNTPEKFFRMSLRSKELLAERLVVYYAWSQGDRWDVPKSPRWSYKDSPYLLKMQVAGLTSNEDATKDSCSTFLADLIPEIDRVLGKQNSH